MSEGIKTLTYSGIALLVALVAYAWRPSDVSTDTPASGARVLFESFQDIEEAKEIEITSYDETLSESRKLVVQQQKNGRWIIPTHDNYPADAEKQLREAATLLFQLRSEGLASEVIEDHEMFGVKSPEKDQVKRGEKGVGLQVRLKDGKGETIAALIIGGKVKNSEDQRFARIPNQEPVYVVKIDPAKLSTKFADWIEKDLLKLNAFDVSRVRLRDYSVGPTQDGGFELDPRLEADVNFDSTASQWKLNSLQTFVRGKAVDTQLGEAEELNKEKLDALKTALDDLQIVDVHPKPKGLRADLKTDAGFLNDREGVQSLIARGFYPLRTRDAKETELYSANGEVHVAMKDGYEYVLRFGNIAGAEEGSDEAKLNRFLFVLARVDESQFTPPELEPEVAGPATTEKPEAPQGKDCADDEKPAEKQPEEKKPTDAAGEKPTEKPAEKASEKPAGDKKDPAEEREQIKKNNQRKMDEFNERRKKAENKVAELNVLFADWYYVIPEDTYKKIHLSRVDLIREKTATADDGIGVDSFRKLQKDGVNPPPPPPAAGGRPGGLPGGLPPGFGLPPE